MLTQERRSRFMRSFFFKMFSAQALLSRRLFFCIYMRRSGREDWADWARLGQSEMYNGWDVKYSGKTAAVTTTFPYTSLGEHSKEKKGNERKHD